MYAYYLEQKKKMKALRNLDEQPIEELVSWITETMDRRYPVNRKRAFEILSSNGKVNIILFAV